jgi:hypothetical protein
MRLDLLLKRENFAQTFEQSFAKYLLDVFGVVAVVNWRGGSKSNTSLLVNHKLNVVYSKSIDRVKLKSIVSEYAYHPNILRRFLQETYTQLAVCNHFEWLFVKTRVEVSPWFSNLNGLCIIPGNHSIRIIDLESSSCRVVLKEGFSAQFIKNEIYLRERYKFLPTPKLLNTDLEDLWYEEVQVSALPLNRIDDQDVKDRALLDAQTSLLSLYSKTLEKVNLDGYTQSLYDSCDNLITKLPDVYAQDEKDKIKGILELLTTALDGSNECDIELAQSHGDFQPANILVDNTDQQLYLIDWEYTAKRSVYYDALVFATQCRSPQGLSARIRVILNEANISWNWCIKNVRTKLSNLELVVFLIEDLMVRLSELQIPNMISKDDGLNVWMNEIKKLVSMV